MPGPRLLLLRTFLIEGGVVPPGRGVESSDELVLAAVKLVELPQDWSRNNPLRVLRIELSVLRSLVLQGQLDTAAGLVNGVQLLACAGRTRVFRPAAGTQVDRPRHAIVCDLHA